MDAGIIAAAQLGIQAILIRPARRIADFEAQVTIEESHVDELEITEQPVELGARITDHAFKRPSVLTIQCGWSNSPSGYGQGLLGSLLSPSLGTVAGIQSIVTGNAMRQVNEVYQKLQDLQNARIPFTVVTGKRVYNNMLIASLKTVTDKETEHSLLVTATFKQVILVTTSTITNEPAPVDQQAQPKVTAPVPNSGTKSLKPAQNYNSATTENT